VTACTRNPGKHVSDGQRNQGRQPDATEWTVSPDEVSLRLDVFLAVAGRLGTRGRASWALERGKVFLNDQDAGPADSGRRLAAGDRVRLWMDRPGSARTRLRRADHPDGGLQIVFEDDALIVVNKPPGLLTVPLARRADASSVLEQLSAHLRTKGKRHPLVVHRIDRDTSGLVVFATNAATQRGLKEQFARREPERVYLAVVAGVPDPTTGEWRDYLTWDGASLVQQVSDRHDPRAQESQSRYAVRERFRTANASLVEVRLITGKRNQIRVQAQRRGHPLLGEQMYTSGTSDPGHVFGRQALHAWRLSFRHPVSSRVLALEAPLPVDLRHLVESLRARDGQRREQEGRSPKKQTRMGTVPPRSSSYES